MERLTVRDATLGLLPDFENNGVNGCYDIPDAEWLEESIERLALIEDILGDDYDLDRLRELVGADRDGRCMVLPCEVGTQVWCIVEVARYGYPDPTFEKQLFLRPFKMEWAGDIGKTKFLTRKAAEAALKAMEQDE